VTHLATARKVPALYLCAAHARHYVGMGWRTRSLATGETNR
jgi:hypothetical protein